MVSKTRAAHFCSLRTYCAEYTVTTRDTNTQKGFAFVATDTNDMRSDAYNPFTKFVSASGNEYFMYYYILSFQLLLCTIPAPLIEYSDTVTS